jgi:hypothetical protein
MQDLVALWDTDLVPMFSILTLETRDRGFPGQARGNAPVASGCRGDVIRRRMGRC